jgi:transcriptional regulator with XRE-family HTH domain
MELWNLLRAARERRGWSLSQAARLIGITKSHLHDLEHGRSNNPTLTVVASLVITYKISSRSIIETALK